MTAKRDEWKKKVCDDDIIIAPTAKKKIGQDNDEIKITYLYKGWS